MMILHCLWILKHPLQFHLNSFSSNSVERYTPFYPVGFNDEILEAAKSTCKTHFIWRGSCFVNKDCIHRNPIRRSWCCTIWREDNRLYICEWSVRWGKGERLRNEDTDGTAEEFSCWSHKSWANAKALHAFLRLRKGEVIAVEDLGVQALNLLLPLGEIEVHGDNLKLIKRHLSLDKLVIMPSEHGNDLANSRPFSYVLNEKPPSL